MSAELLDVKCPDCGANVEVLIQADSLEIARGIDGRPGTLRVYASGVAAHTCDRKVKAA